MKKKAYTIVVIIVLVLVSLWVIKPLALWLALFLAVLVIVELFVILRLRRHICQVCDVAMVGFVVLQLAIDATIFFGVGGNEILDIGGIGIGGITYNWLLPIMFGTYGVTTILLLVNTID
jgi:hypothetical protein